MAPSPLADEVAGANSADSFVSNVPEMLHDTALLLKLFLLRAWLLGAGPKASQSARS